MAMQFNCTKNLGNMIGILPIFRYMDMIYKCLIVFFHVWIFLDFENSCVMVGLSSSHVMLKDDLAFSVFCVLSVGP